jgi:hypothetical protein
LGVEVEELLEDELEPPPPPLLGNAGLVFRLGLLEVNPPGEVFVVGAGLGAGLVNGLDGAVGKPLELLVDLELLDDEVVAITLYKY